MLTRYFLRLIFILRFTHNIGYNKMRRHYKLDTEEKRAKRVFIIIFYLSAIIMLAITFYAVYISANEYFKTRKIVVGEVLVNTEFPLHGVTKLVTYLMIVSVISWYSAIKLFENKLANMSTLRLSLF